MKNNSSFLSISKQELWLIPLFIIAILVAFWGLTNTFYQQDEWQILGHNMAQGISNITHYASPLDLILGEGRPLIRAVNLVFFGVFRYTVVPIAIFALVFHTINTWLVYKLGRKLLDNIWIAAFAALFFAVNAVSRESVTWAAATGTLPAMTLVLLAIATYFDFVETGRRRSFIISLALIFLSLLFKEIGIFLILLLPIIHYLYAPKSTIWQTVKANQVLFYYGAAIVVFRLIQLATATTQVGSLTTGTNESTLLTFAYRAILYPITGLAQPLFPALPFYELAERIGHIQYPYLKPTILADIVPQTIIADQLMVIIALLILVKLAYIAWRRQGKDNAPLVTILCLTLFSFLPYIIVNRGSSYLDSRYYYVGVAGTGLLIGYILDYLRTRHWVGTALAAIIALTLIGWHIQATRLEVSNQIAFGQDRLGFLNAIKKDMPKLQSGQVIYITGNRDHTIPNNKVPFQQGIGNTLLVWYYDPQVIPASWLTQNVFWDLGSEGYEEHDGFAFGIYQDKAKLQAALQAGQFSFDDVTAYSYNSDTKTLTNITDQLAVELLYVTD